MEYILYTFNLHIGICSNIRNEIQLGKPITLSNATNWWLSTKSLLNQISLAFKIHDNSLQKKMKPRDEMLNKFNSKINGNDSLINDKNGMASKVKDDLLLNNKNREKKAASMVHVTRSNSCMPSLTLPSSLSSALPNATNNKSNNPIQTPTNIYIRNLPSNTTDESLFNLCKKYGKIVSAKAMVDIRTNECKGFGFVMYEKEEQAKKAIDALNKLKYFVSYARSGSPFVHDAYGSRLKNLEDSTSLNIYISNLPLEVDDKQLLNLFKPHKVLSHRILRNEDGVSRGVAFARFSTRESAQSIIEKYNNTMLANSNHHALQVRFADSLAQKRLKSQISSVNKHNNNHQPRNPTSPSTNPTTSSSSSMTNITSTTSTSTPTFTPKFTPKFTPTYTPTPTTTNLNNPTLALTK